MDVSLKLKHALRIAGVSLGLCMVSHHANAAQCLVKNLPDQNGVMFEVQAQAKTSAERKVMEGNGFERVNCKELSARQIAETEKMCALIVRMSEQVISEITQELGVSPDAICAMAQDGIKASDAVKADTLSQAED